MAGMWYSSCVGVAVQRYERGLNVCLAANIHLAHSVECVMTDSKQRIAIKFDSKT